MERTPWAPTSLAWRVSRRDSAVLFDPAPARTGTRPAADSTTNSTTRSCSGWLKVGDSPVVPHGTRASVPSVTWNSTRSFSFASSTSPSLNGVTSATMQPVNIAGVPSQVSFSPCSRRASAAAKRHNPCATAGLARPCSPRRASAAAKRHNPCATAGLARPCRSPPPLGREIGAERQAAGCGRLTSPRLSRSAPSSRAPPVRGRPAPPARRCCDRC